MITSNNPTQYSELFTCIHDQDRAVGFLAPGVHYSIFSHSERQTSEPRGLFLHRLAVIWDADHDTRIIEVLEKMKRANLLEPVLFIGERKGNVTVIISKAHADRLRESGVAKYRERLAAIAHNISGGDKWSVIVGSLHIVGVDMLNDGEDDEEGNTQGIVLTDERRARAFLQGISAQWNIGGTFQPSP